MQAFADWLAPRESELINSVSRDWFKPEPNINLNTSRTFVSTDIKYFLLADIEGRFPQSWARPERLTLPTSTSNTRPLLVHTVPGIQTDLPNVPQGFVLRDQPSINARRSPTSPLSSLPPSPRVSDSNDPPHTPSDPDIEIGAGPTDEDIQMASPVGSNGPMGPDDEPSDHEMDNDPGFRIKLRSKKKAQSPLNSPKPSKPVDTKGLRPYAKKNMATKTSRHSVLDGLTADHAIDVDSIFVCNFLLHRCLCSLIY